VLTIPLVAVIVSLFADGKSVNLSVPLAITSSIKIAIANDDEPFVELMVDVNVIAYVPLPGKTVISSIGTYDVDDVVSGPIENLCQPSRKLNPLAFGMSKLLTLHSGNPEALVVITSPFCPIGKCRHKSPEAYINPPSMGFDGCVSRCVGDNKLWPLVAISTISTKARSPLSIDKT
jgi:hypothetical protein